MSLNKETKPNQVMGLVEDLYKTYGSNNFLVSYFLILTMDRTL